MVTIKLTAFFVRKVEREFVKTAMDLLREKCGFTYEWVDIGNMVAVTGCASTVMDLIGTVNGCGSASLRFVEPVNSSASPYKVILYEHEKGITSVYGNYNTARVALQKCHSAVIAKPDGYMAAIHYGDWCIYTGKLENGKLNDITPPHIGW